MVLLQNTNQMFPCNVCAPLGHGNRAMSKEALYNTNRGSDRLQNDACGVAMWIRGRLINGHLQKQRQSYCFAHNWLREFRMSNGI